MNLFEASASSSEEEESEESVKEELASRETEASASKNEGSRSRKRKKDKQSRGKSKLHGNEHLVSSQDSKFRKHSKSLYTSVSLLHFRINSRCWKNKWKGRI